MLKHFSNSKVLLLISSPTPKPKRFARTYTHFIDHNSN